METMFETVFVALTIVLTPCTCFPLMEPLPVLPSFDVQEADVLAAHVDPIENIGVELEGAILEEGDIWVPLPSEPMEVMKVDDDNPAVTKSHQVRNSVATEEQTWDDKRIPYVLDPTLNETERQLIIEAMVTIMEESGNCVEFVNKTTQPNFIFITQQLSGCYSEVGMKGGNQTVSVSRDSGCIITGIIMHELIHALGFWHEHTRPDRDNFINVITSNVLFNHLGDFTIRQEGKVLVQEYDYYSVMHYKTTAFSKDESSLRTMEILQDGINETLVGQREFLSNYDKQRIRLLYGCDKARRTLATEIPNRDLQYPNPVPNAISGETQNHGENLPSQIVYSPDDGNVRVLPNVTETPQRPAVTQSVRSTSTRRQLDVGQADEDLMPF